jgi:starch synthase
LPGEFFGIEGCEFYGYLNCLKAGIAFADRITTVSPRYAREIATEEFGCALDGFLRKRQGRLTGILNGVDYHEWTTTNNRFLKASYSVTRSTGKSRNKTALQKELGLPVSAKTPLFGTVSRLADQKGIDIELGALEEMLGTGLQFVLLGSGSPLFERAFVDLAERYPRQVAVRIGFNEGLSHRIEAGCDFYLMPSQFEPCGLNQMYSLRYGTIPVVRSVGGLDDSVIDYSVSPERANGIKFREYSPIALAKAIRKALALYQSPDLLRQYRRNAMTADFSWERTVQDYLKVYQAAVAGRVA